jgi:hypothetical protein
LESKNDIFQRGFVRFFWCLITVILIGGLATILSYRQINIWQLVVVSFVATVVVTILGILIDFMRLNKQQKT